MDGADRHDEAHAISGSDFAATPHMRQRAAVLCGNQLGIGRGQCVITDISTRCWSGHRVSNFGGSQIVMWGQWSSEDSFHEGLVVLLCDFLIGNPDVIVHYFGIGFFLDQQIGGIDRFLALRNGILEHGVVQFTFVH
jgi:hypothetical protein